MAVKSVSIIGLGLIGGSLAKAFRQQYSHLDIYAVDNNTDSLELAKQEGVINDGFLQCSEPVFNSDIIFICTPIRRTVEILSELNGKVKPDCILTDVSSTKGEVTRYIDGLENPPVFIGGHPMAGTEKSGYANSFAHMFENAYYVLTPTVASTSHAVEILKSMLSGIGAIATVVSADQHDTVTGCISHVPHIIASALVTLAKDSENGEGLVKQLAAGGFKDITRIASSNPSMWEDIILSNGGKVIDLLNQYKAIVDGVIDDIRNTNPPGIYDFFNNAKQFRDGFSTNQVGLIPKNFELILDVPDQPGIIGKIATLLGCSGINIKNINVSNSRELEQGCLRITLSDQANTDKAYAILLTSGYKVFRRD